MRPRYATGLELQVERQELRRGDRVAAIASGEDEVEVGMVCTQSFDVWRRIGDDTRSRVTARATVSFGWAVVVRRAGEKRVAEPVPLWVEP